MLWGPAPAKVQELEVLRDAESFQMSDEDSKMTTATNTADTTWCARACGGALWGTIAPNTADTHCGVCGERGAGP